MVLHAAPTVRGAAHTVSRVVPCRLACDDFLPAWVAHGHACHLGGDRHLQLGPVEREVETLHAAEDLRVSLVKLVEDPVEHRGLSEEAILVGCHLRQCHSATVPQCCVEVDPYGT